MFARALLNTIKVAVPSITAFAATNAALPRPTVYVRTRITKSDLGRSKEEDPRVQLIFGNVGAGVLIPETFEWTSHGVKIDEIPTIVRDCGEGGSVECTRTRRVYLDKPFESHAKLHLLTFRPVDIEDTTFHTRVVDDLSDADVHARVTYRYFHSKWGPRSTRDIELVNSMPH